MNVSCDIQMAGVYSEKDWKLEICFRLRVYWLLTYKIVVTVYEQAVLKKGKVFLLI